jgi:hypothetical protein
LLRKIACKGSTASSATPATLAAVAGEFPSAEFQQANS